jgi:hypothetical protein
LTILHEASAGRLRDIDRIATAALKRGVKQGLSSIDRAVIVAVVGEQQR